jgi:hypothetical protein
MENGKVAFGAGVNKIELREKKKNWAGEQVVQTCEL